MWSMVWCGVVWCVGHGVVWCGVGLLDKVRRG